MTSKLGCIPDAASSRVKCYVCPESSLLDVVKSSLGGIIFYAHLMYKVGLTAKYIYMQKMSLSYKIFQF